MSSQATGSRNACSQSSQLTEPLLTDSDQKSEISKGELISSLKHKEVQAGNDLSILF